MQDDKLAEAIYTLVTNSALIDRMKLAGVSGMMFDHSRDVFAAAGYEKRLSFDMLYDAYRRQDVAKRIVRAAPDETWRLPPAILDGETAEDGSDQTPFAKAVAGMIKGAQIGAADAQPGLWHYANRLDRISGIGRYGIMLLGVRGVEDLQEPLLPAKRKPEDLLYISVYHEGKAEIAEYVEDVNDPRYGKPLYYNISVGVNADRTTTTRRRVHWTHAIHVAEDLEDDDTFGTPRLEACWNRVADILKIMAGSGEAAWKLLDAGHIITTREGAKLPSKADDVRALEDQIDEFVNGLRRWLLAEGLDTSRLDGSVTDPSGLVYTNIALISAATGIPQRILLGSERGELASSQDEGNWAKQIETRQQAYVEPQIIRPLINRLIYAGILPMPTTENFVVEWKPLVDSDRARDAGIAATVADALTKIGAEIDPILFAETYFPDLPKAAVKKPPKPPQPLIGIAMPRGANGGAQPPQQGAAGEPEPEPENGGEPAVNAARFRLRTPKWVVAGEPVEYP